MLLLVSLSVFCRLFWGFYGLFVSLSVLVVGLSIWLVLLTHVSDKTGTLTENIMEFKLASINSVIHEDSHKRGDLRKLLDVRKRRCE